MNRIESNRIEPNDSEIEKWNCRLCCIALEWNGKVNESLSKWEEPKQENGSLVWGCEVERAEGGRREWFARWQTVDVNASV